MINNAFVELTCTHDIVIIYIFQTSVLTFYLQRVRLVIAAKGINDCDIVNIKLRNEIPEWFAAINPLGQVPALEFPNGDAICESLIISGM